MKTIKRKYNTYDFSELNESAKERARQWYLDDDMRSSDWENEIEQDLMTMFPNSDLHIQFSLNSCQGDGVKSHTTEVACFHTCFSGGMDSLTEDTVITPQLHAV